MREMSSEIATGREHAIEAERSAAFRESARRFAHELKNPLTPIQFAVARLQRAAPPELTEVVDVLRAETARLDRLARDFAQFGRLPDGPVSDVDVGELVRYTSQATVPAGVALTLDVPADGVTIRGRHDALQRALANVLLNAVDACGPDGRIAVSVASASREGVPAVEIRVRDSGPGIPPERIKTIWEPYVTSKPGGTGLGLAIARQAILAHDGSARVECPPGGGTEFRFLIPANHESAQGRSSIA
jgi:signal transduction histidine kinase